MAKCAPKSNFKKAAANAKKKVGKAPFMKGKPGESDDMPFGKDKGKPKPFGKGFKPKLFGRK